MKVICKPSRARIAAGSPQSLGVLVRLMAPEPPASRTRRPVTIVAVIDVSGSMKHEKLRSVQRALTRLVDHLVPGDSMALVKFDTEVDVRVPLREVAALQRETLLTEIRNLHAGSQTNLGGGILSGLSLAAAVPAQQPRVIVLTDGLANVGPATTPGQVVELVRTRLETTSVSAFGYGRDCDHVLLAEVARAGRGSFAYIDSDDVAMTAFARELGGLLATYATAIEVRVNEGPVEAVNELLFQSGRSVWLPLELPAQDAGAKREVARVQVEYRDELGKAQRLSVPVYVDVITDGTHDAEDDPEVVRVRDERRLAAAQSAAEECARRGDFAAAQLVLSEAGRKIEDKELRRFLRDQLLECYAGDRAYASSSVARACSVVELRDERSVTIVPDLAWGRPKKSATPLEVAAEKSFKGGVSPRPKTG